MLSLIPDVLLYAKGMQLKYQIIQQALTFCRGSLLKFTVSEREADDEFELRQLKFRDKVGQNVLQDMVIMTPTFD